MSGYERELDVAVEAVRRASRVCRSVQAKVAPEASSALAKPDKSPVTVADFASQALVCQALLAAFPEDPVVAEEDTDTLRDRAGEPLFEKLREELGPFGVTTDGEILSFIGHGGAVDYSPRFWTLDPIDGTKGFLRRDQYAIALALVVDGRVTVAALGCPNLDLPDEPPGLGSVYWAVRGEGARAAPLFEEAVPRAIAVSRQSDVAEFRTCESFESGHSAHDESARVVEMLGIAAAPVRLDSQAKYAIVARGDAELYLRLPTRKDYREKIWDHAAGALVVMEAGGTVTDVRGKPLDFTRGHELVGNRGVVATHGPGHARVLAALREIGVE
jgi:3'(2'), 5'-bisphosphate nucleotidase